MKQTICYLYEYEYNRQSRNVGFIKCIFHQDKVTFQIHGKGLECNKTIDLEMFLFTGNDDGVRLDKAGIVEGARGNVNYKVTVDHMNIEKLYEYDGIVLVAPSKRRYVATWKRKEIHLDFMETKSQEQEICYEEEPQEDQICCEEEPQEERICYEEEPREERICYEEEPQEEQICYKEEPQEEQRCYKEEPQEEQRCYEEAPQANSRYTYEKIQRQDIARLQQREWRLANNNFLIHGYANYKHLVFVRQDENLYLGIPGVFHKKEAEIAHSFGFSNFHKIEDAQFLRELEDCECSPEEGFGYWCRPVAERRGR